MKPLSTELHKWTTKFRDKICNKSIMGYGKHHNKFNHVQKCFFIARTKDRVMPRR